MIDIREPEDETSSIPSLLLGEEDITMMKTNSNTTIAAPAASTSSRSPTMYKYRDFGAVSEDQLHAEGRSSSPDGGGGGGDEDAPSPPPSRGQMTSGNQKSAEGSSIRVQKFPVKLYTILARPEFQEIITWMPHGRSWKVLKPHLFESMVMPLFFEYSNYHSFNRLINAWSFRRVSSGPDRGSYYHEVRFVFVIERAI
jgi:hypothetical protein